MPPAGPPMPPTALAAKPDAAVAETAREPGAPVAFDELATLVPLVQPSAGPHSIYAVTTETLSWVAEVAAERSMPV